MVGIGRCVGGMDFVPDAQWNLVKDMMWTGYPELLGRENSVSFFPGEVGILVWSSGASVQTEFGTVCNLT